MAITGVAIEKLNIHKNGTILGDGKTVRHRVAKPRVKEASVGGWLLMALRAEQKESREARGMRGLPASVCGVADSFRIAHRSRAAF
jgi:hypothetical protein